MSETLFHRVRLAQRVHGPLDGLIITLYRACYRRRWYRLGSTVQWASDRLEAWWFPRNWDAAKKQADAILKMNTTLPASAPAEKETR